MLIYDGNTTKRTGWKIPHIKMSKHGSPTQEDLDKVIKSAKDEQGVIESNEKEIRHVCKLQTEGLLGGAIGVDYKLDKHGGFKGKGKQTAVAVKRSRCTGESLSGNRLPCITNLRK